MTLHDHIYIYIYIYTYSNFNISISFRPSITFVGSKGILGSVRGRSLKAVTATCLVSSSSFFLYRLGAFTCACILFFYGYYTGACNAPVFCFSLVLLSLFLFSVNQITYVPSSCFDRFQWNLVTMINDPACICQVILDWVKGHPRSQGSKKVIFTKIASPLTDYIAWSCDLCILAWDPLQKLLDHFLSEVIWGHKVKFKGQVSENIQK